MLRIFSGILPPALLIVALSGCDAPQTPEEHVSRALEFIQKGDQRAGLIELKNAVQKAPRDEGARVLLAEHYLRLGDLKAAEKEASRARDLGASPDSWMLPLGEAQLGQREFEAVLATVEPQSLSDAETRARALGLRGDALRQMKELDDAEAAYEQALAIQPENAPSLAGLGRVALERRDLETATAHMQRAQAVSGGKDLQTQLLRGDIAFANQQYDAAVEAFQDAIEINPYDPLPQIALGWALVAADRNEEAIALVDPLLKSNPNNLALNYLKATAAYRVDDYRTVVRLTEPLLLAEPSHAPTLLISGGANLALGSLERARRDLAIAVDREPGNGVARELLALVEARLERRSLPVDGSLPEPTSDPQIAGLIDKIGERLVDPQPRRLRVAMLDTGSEASLVDAAVRQEPEPEADSEPPRRSDALTLDEVLETLRNTPNPTPEQLAQGVAAISVLLQTGRYEEALSTAEILQERLPQSPHGHTLAGMALLGLERTDEAKAAFEEGHALAPTDPNAALNLANFALLENDLDSARALYDEVLAADPNHLRTLLAYARLEARAEKPEAAIERLQAAAKAHPEQSEPRLLLGRIYLQSNRPGDAYDVARDALAKQPDDPALLEVVGRAQMAMGADDLAIKHLQRLVQERPGDADARHYLALALEQSGRPARALEEARAALRSDAEHRKARLQEVRLLTGLGRLESAQAKLQQLREDFPEEAGLVALQGRLALARGSLQEASEAFRTAQEMQPNSGNLVQLASTLWLEGEQKEALALLDDWLAEYPGDILALLVLGDFHRAAQEHGKAAETYERIVESVPNHVRALNSLAWSLYRAGRADEALSYSERAYALAETSTEVQDTLGAILVAVGKPDRALPLLESAAAGSDDPGTRFHLAKAKAETGDVRRAREILLGVLNTDRTFEEREAAEELLANLENQ